MEKYGSLSSRRLPGSAGTCDSRNCGNLAPPAFFLTLNAMEVKFTPELQVKLEHVAAQQVHDTETHV